jgi:hypothetical protein
MTTNEELIDESTPVEVILNGQKIMVDPKTNPRLISQITNIRIQQQEAEFAGVRKSFVADAVEQINDEVMTDDMAVALEGMCLVIPLDGEYEALKDTKGAVLVPNERVTVKQRGRKPKEE